MFHHIFWNETKLKVKIRLLCFEKEQKQKPNKLWDQIDVQVLTSLNIKPRLQLFTFVVLNDCARMGF